MNSTLGYRHRGWIGYKGEFREHHSFSDAEPAGCVNTHSSTTGSIHMITAHSGNFQLRWSASDNHAFLTPFRSRKSSRCARPSVPLPSRLWSFGSPLSMGGRPPFWATMSPCFKLGRPAATRRCGTLVAHTVSLSRGSMNNTQVVSMML